MDYYKILNLKEDAGLKQIEQAYLDLSSFYNPSNNVSKEAYKRYREINKAYLVLKEEKQRELYNLTLKKEEVNKEEIKGNSHTYKEFVSDSLVSEDIAKFKDVIVDDEFSNYLKLNIEVPYLYFLVNSEYLVTYNKKEIISEHGICDTCLGIGKVKKDNKIVYCSDCLATGKKIETINKSVSDYYTVEDKIIDRDNKIIIEFTYLNKDEYKVNGNIITYKHIVSEDEFKYGIKYELKNNDDLLIIEEKDFKVLNKTYIFKDKIINIEYVLDEYNKDIKYGYIVTDRDLIYLNPSDFTYSFTSTDTFTFRVELTSKQVSFNLNKQDYIINIIKINNENDLKIFFDKSIKKVSANLFKFKGVYNNHYFKNKNFEYDDNYLYIPNKAYKLKNKNYSLFKILYLSLFLIVPLILFMIFGISYVFFITSFVFIVVYLVGINLLMEVKM